MNLYEYNQISIDRFKTLESYELIEKIIFSKEQTEEIGKLINKYYGGFYQPWEDVKQVKEVITVFLVGCAKYFYNNGEGGFWDAVKRLTNYSRYLKEEFLKAFKTTIKFYDLESFENERVSGYTQMGSILAHAGLAENVENSLIYTIAGLMGRNIEFENLGEEILNQCEYATETIKSYLNVLNKLGIINDVVFDVLYVLNASSMVTDDSLSIPISLQEKINEYKTTIKNREVKSERVISKPEMFFEIEENQMFISFPEQSLYDCDSLSWIIYNDNEVIRKNIIAEYIENKYLFRSSLIRIEPGSSIRIELRNSFEETLSKYVIKEANQAVVFNENGQFLKNGVLTNKGGYVLLENTFISDAPTIVNSYNKTNLFCIDAIEEENSINFINGNGYEIKILIKKQIELLCDDKLFSESCKFSGINGYFSLPSILIPNDGLWSIKVNIEGEKYLADINICEELRVVNLADYIPENIYGKISIRLTNAKLGTKTFRFVHLPEIRMFWNGFESGVGGYNKHYISFEERDGICVLDKNNNYKSKYEIFPEDEIFNGVYQIKEKKYDFQLNLRAYTWKFENNSNIIGTPNTYSSLSIKDLSSDGECLLTLKNNTIDNVYFIIDNGGEGKKIFEIKSYRKRVINLKEYIEYLSLDGAAANLYLEADYKRVCEIASIRKNLAIRNLTISNVNNVFVLMWDEDGVKQKRELRCRYISAPYEHFTLPIEDGKTLLLLDANDPIFNNNMILEIVPQKEENIFLQQANDDQEDILDETNSIVFNLNKLEKIIFDFENHNYGDFKNAVYTFLMYRFNKNLINNQMLYNKCLIELLNYIRINRIFFGDELLLSILLKYNLSRAQFAIVRKDFGLMYPILKEKIPIDKKQYIAIERLDKMLYVVYAFFKLDYDHLEKITAYNLNYLEQFKDAQNKNITWESVEKLFPDIYNYGQLTKKKEIAQYLNNGIRDAEAYLESIIAEFTQAFNRNDESMVEDYKIFAQYIENVREKYSKKLIMTIFRQLSKRRK